MKSSLRRLTIAGYKVRIPLVVLALLGILVVVLSRLADRARSPAINSSEQHDGATTRASQGASARPRSGREGEPLDGDGLVLASIEQLTRGPSVTARLQQRVQLREREVLGVGAYRQESLKVGGRFNLQVRTKAGGLQIVSDGSFIWRHVSVGDSSRVTRVDLQQYARLTGDEQAADRTDTQSWSVLPRQVSPLELGGIPQLLSAIAQQFRFHRVQRKRLSNVPIYELEGIRAPASDPAQSTPPAQVPSHVTLSLGRDDLFPYRIIFECRGASTAEQEKGVPRRVQIQFSEVTFGAAVDNRWFEYSPRDVAWEDVTAELASQAGNAS